MQTKYGIKQIKKNNQGLNWKQKLRKGFKKRLLKEQGSKLDKKKWN
jgi:hypothetical protein